VTAFLIHVHTPSVSGAGRAATEYGYTLPFLSENGRFEADGLPKGPATVSVVALDDSKDDVGEEGYSA